MSAVPGVPPVMLLTGDRRYQRLSEGEGRRGSFGNVAIAIDLVTNSTVALKRQEVPSEVAEREYAAYCALRRWPHPNVQHMLDHFILRDNRGRSYLHTVHEFFDSTLWHLYRSDVVQVHEISLL